MRELSEKNLLPNDYEGFDRFCWQFGRSLEDADTKEEIYWHGRLVGIGYDLAGNKQEYRIKFFGKEYNEREWRDKLEKREIVINKFEITGTPVYTPDANSSPNHLDPQTVEVTYYIEAFVDGEEKKGEFRVKHNIRRTYLSFHTEVG